MTDKLCHMVQKQQCFLVDTNVWIEWEKVTVGATKYEQALSWKTISYYVDGHNDMLDNIYYTNMYQMYKKQKKTTLKFYFYSCFFLFNFV